MSQSATQFKPERDDIDEGTYALVIYNDGQDLWRFEPPTPWDDPEWALKRQYEHGEVPPLDLKSAIVEQEADNGSLRVVTLYAGDIDAEARTSSPVSQPEAAEPTKGYVVEVSDGQRIPADSYHTTQETNMGELADYLVREYDLIDRINIPYLPPKSRKNCLINDKPEHPRGQGMRSSYELSSGYYLFTNLNREQKKRYMRVLADLCDLELSFKGEW